MTSVNEKIVKAFAFCPKEKWAKLPKMPARLRNAIIEEIRIADLPHRRPINLEQMSDVGICWALITVWSLLFVKEAFGVKALKRTTLRCLSQTKK